MSSWIKSHLHLEKVPFHPEEGPIYIGKKSYLEKVSFAPSKGPISPWRKSLLAPEECLFSLEKVPFGPQPPAK